MYTSFSDSERSFGGGEYIFGDSEWSFAAAEWRIQAYFLDNKKDIKQEYKQYLKTIDNNSLSRATAPLYIPR